MIVGIGVGAVLVLSLIAIMGFAVAQNNENVQIASGFDTNTVESSVAASSVNTCANGGSCGCGKKATGFVDANNDGVCDNAGTCAMNAQKGGCSGNCGGSCGGSAGSCGAKASGSGCGCKKAVAVQ